MLKVIKHYAVHAFGLILSLSAIYHTMTQFSDEPIFKLYFGIGGIFAGLSIQYLRGLAAAYRKRDEKNDKNKALGFWAVVIICICIFDFLSAFSIAVTQIDKGEQQYTILSDQKQEIGQDIKDLEQDIKDKKGQQDAEFIATNSKRGPNYNNFEAEIKAKQGQIDAKKIALDKLKAEMAVLKKSSFARLSEKTGIPSFWIEFTMFAGLMFLIYFVPLLTPWEIALKGNAVTNIPSNVVTVTPNKPTASKVVTSKPFKDETAVTGGLITCECGCGIQFPPAFRNPGKRFYGNHRIKASRARKKELKEVEG